MSAAAAATAPAPPAKATDPAAQPYEASDSKTVAALIMLGVSLAESGADIDAVLRQMRPQLDRLRPAHWESVRLFTQARRRRVADTERYGR